MPEPARGIKGFGPRGVPAMSEYGLACLPHGAPTWALISKRMPSGLRWLRSSDQGDARAPFAQRRSAQGCERLCPRSAPPNGPALASVYVSPGSGGPLA